MIKIRKAKFCNLKLMLIFLVVYAHLYEPQILSSRFLAVQYKVIYLFHMPAFSFISGMFVKDCSTALAQMKKTLGYYLAFQIACLAFCKGTMGLLVPCWHLWYLLSLALWSGTAWLWLRCSKKTKNVLLLFSTVVAGCAAGFVPFIGRFLSLSRTLVFMPYFFAGLMFGADLMRPKLKLSGAVALMVFTFIALWAAHCLPADFLYMADSYAKFSDVFKRLLCYIAGGSACIALLAFTPKKRFAVTKAGTQTMAVYLLHAPIVLLLRVFSFSWLLCALISAVLIYIISYVSSWCSRQYGVI